MKLKVDRSAGFDEQITLALNPAKEGVAKGIGVVLKPIPKGKNEVDIDISADDKILPGSYTFVLQGTHKKGNVTTSQPAPGITVSIEKPAPKPKPKAK